MDRSPELQRILDALKADTDRSLAAARAYAGDNPELNRLIDEAVAEVEQSRRDNP